MQVRLSVGLAVTVIGGAAMIGCGGGSDGSTGTSTGAPKASDSPTTTKRGSSSKASGRPHRQGATPKTSALSAKERARAQRSVRAVVGCIRAGGPHVSTDSNSPRSAILELGNGVVMRVSWKANGADGYVSTTKNVRAIARSLGRRVHVYKRRLIIVYDKPPTQTQSARIKHCATVKEL